MLEFIKKRCFDVSLPLRIQVFNLLGLMGIATGILIAIANHAAKTGTVPVLLSLATSALAIILLLVAGKQLSFRMCSWITVVAIFLIVFCVLFFSSGGYRSGMPSFFVFALVYTGMLLGRRDRVIALTLECFTYIGCCLIAYYCPETVMTFGSEAHYLKDVISGIVVSGGLLTLVTMFHTRLYRIREIQIRELNRELRARNETLVKYDEMKSNFLATVAHEISRPLTVILGSSADTIELLKENVDCIPECFDEIMENHEIIGQKIMLLDGILTDLMDSAAIETGRLSLSRQHVSLSELLRKCVDTGPVRTSSNNNRLVYDFEDNLPRIWADPGRIEQVMANLLSNADRHTKDGVITIRLIRSDRRQIVSVVDTGEGMEPEMLKSVMKKYVTSSGENWRHGYGLYICRQIIVSHGGEIWMESEKGRGTSVSFALQEEEHE